MAIRKAFEPIDEPRIAALLNKVEGSPIRGNRVERGVVLQIPESRSHREVLIGDVASADVLLSQEFLDTRFIAGYNAILDWPKQRIECSVINLSRRNADLWQLSDSTSVGLDIVFKRPPIDLRFELDGVIQISLSDTSELFNSLGTQRSSGFSIVIEGFSGKLDPAQLLLDVSNSAFFQLELARGVSLGLSRLSATSLDRLDAAVPLSSVGISDLRYDARAMRHYWQAAAARDTPFISFLGYYQVAEYFYPVYQHRTAIDRARLILKDPSFPRDDEVRISKLVEELSNIRSAAGKEREMLKATLQACVSAPQLRALINTDAEMKKFFSKGGGFSSVSDVQPALAASDEVFLESIANRLYDLRCDIVHSKESREDEIPSKEHSYIEDGAILLHDLRIMRFIARSVLIVNSKHRTT